MENFTPLDADDWFERNRTKLESSQFNTLDVEFIYQTLSGCKSKISNLLEIGCASGRKTELLAQLFDARAWGVDLSQVAIDAAFSRSNSSVNDLHFYRSRAQDLDFPNNSMDLIFIGFCLYLMDDGELTLTLDRAHKILASKKFLAVLDFDSGSFISKPDIHNSRLRIFKRDYTKILHSQYVIVSKWSFSHNSASFSYSEDDRVAVSIFQKRT